MFMPIGTVKLLALIAKLYCGMNARPPLGEAADIAANIVVMAVLFVAAVPLGYAAYGVAQ